MPDAYARVGVNYADIDPFKRIAQEFAEQTAAYSEHAGVRELPWSRGESAYLQEVCGANMLIGGVNEGLGTKNLVADELSRRMQNRRAMKFLADEMCAHTGRSFYNSIGRSVAAAVLNDIATLGVQPTAFMLHAAAGRSAWFENEQRARDLCKGVAGACYDAGCSWGGGETPVLKGIVNANAMLLSGSVHGIVQPASRMLNPAAIRSGDTIVLVRSSGIGENGLTLARSIARANRNGGFLARLGNGTYFGIELLKPSPIYVPLVQACLDRGLALRYAINITGHGWRKLMRAPQPFAYVIDHIPFGFAHPEFAFIQKQKKMSDADMYATFNMGAGYAVIVAPEDAERVCKIATKFGIYAYSAGSVQKSETRRVVLVPKEIVYEEESLAIR